MTIDKKDLSYYFFKEMIKPLKKRNRLLKIFLSTLYLSAFTFGGGYVIITLMKQKFVDELHWIDDDEMLDMVAIAQSSPGPIAVNGAVIIGYKLEGIAGVLAAVLGAVLPPFVILTAISMFYSAFKNLFVVQSLLTGMKAGVSAVILSVVYDMAAGVVKGKDRVNIGVMILAFAATYFGKVNVVFVILITIAFGAVRTILREKRGTKA